MRVTFTAWGIPQTAGSKKAFPFRRANGKLGVAVTDTNPHGNAWRAVLIAAMREVYTGPPLEGPLELIVRFYLPRPKGHFTSKGALKATAPTYPIGKPDTTKLLRCAEDAFKGLLWKDDSQVVEQVAEKAYVPINAVPVTAPCVIVTVGDLP